MQHLTALAIEGALLDADEDWLRDMVGLMRHGRWGQQLLLLGGLVIGVLRDFYDSRILLQLQAGAKLAPGPPCSHA
jgi:hypothetical protein